MYGTSDWLVIAALLGSRNPRQCRERFSNYLAPSLRREPWSSEEDALIIEQYAVHGAKWSKIAKLFANRSENAIRNRWQLMARRQVREATGGPPIRRHRDRFGTKMPIQPVQTHSHCPGSGAVSDILRVERNAEGKIADPFEMTETMETEWNLFGDGSADSWSAFPLF
jgi:hypothetical protein